MLGAVAAEVLSDWQMLVVVAVAMLACGCFGKII